MGRAEAAAKAGEMKKARGATDGHLARPSYRFACY